MVTETNSEFGLGEYWTAAGQRAVVDAVVDGVLVGRIDINKSGDGNSHWFAALWSPSGRHHLIPTDSLRREKSVRIVADYWVNIYPSGPGQLRKTWEEALIEASSCEEDVLCRVRVSINAEVGEGLK